MRLGKIGIGSVCGSPLGFNPITEIDAGRRRFDAAAIAIERGN
jgi:hypothetical protein